MSVSMSNNSERGRLANEDETKHMFIYIDSNGFPFFFLGRQDTCPFSFLSTSHTPNMDMDLLFTVKRLADVRAATRPPRSQPRRISLRERRAQAIAGQDSRLHEESLLRAKPPDADNARLRALNHRARQRGKCYTRQQTEDACRALLDAGWDPAADVEEEDSSDSDEEEEEGDSVVEARAQRLNARAERLWEAHEEGIAQTTPRYVEGFPMRFVEGPPKVQRRIAGVRESGSGRCRGCEGEGLRCSRVMERRRRRQRCGQEEEGCERCRRRGEECEDAGGQAERGVRMEVMGGKVVEVDEGRFAPVMPVKEW